MKSCKVIPFVLAGGSGTRLWPVSRRAFPKQFVPLLDEDSLFQQTCKRLQQEIFESPIVVGNEEHRFIIADQTRQIGVSPVAIILEPLSRNTAPAALIASLMAFNIDEEALVLLLPSDQFIADDEAFAESVAKGVETARAGNIVTFGVEPDSPHTGYGYIKAVPGDGPVLKVERFVEKPLLGLAKKYLQEGNHYWNAGIFLFTAGNMLKAFRQHAPYLLEPCSTALRKAREDLGFLRLDKAAYKLCRDISIDYAIMEKVRNIYCVPLRTRWTDLGSWTAMADALEKDELGNSGKGNVMFHNSRNCMAYSTDSTCISVNGLENTLVVATPDAILVTSREDAQRVGDIVKTRRSKGCPTVELHKRVYRPWGWYECLQKGKGFQVKRLMVKPGEKLSLQSHRFRSEHWVVVQGSLRATVDDKVIDLKVNESVYIPVGTRHRLENPTDKPAYLIEVQTGSYLGEDDIIRYEDVYNREAEGGV